MVQLFCHNSYCIDAKENCMKQMCQHCKIGVYPELQMLMPLWFPWGVVGFVSGTRHFQLFPPKKIFNSWSGGISTRELVLELHNTSTACYSAQALWASYCFRFMIHPAVSKLFSCISSDCWGGWEERTGSRFSWRGRRRDSPSTWMVPTLICLPLLPLLMSDQGSKLQQVRPVSRHCL